KCTFFKSEINYLGHNEELLEGTFLQRLFDLIEVLPKVRNDAIKRVEKAQESAKIKHDKT
ncbi:17392_t:CDS:2, partial [Gigaspora rosea]